MQKIEMKYPKCPVVGCKCEQGEKVYLGFDPVKKKKLIKQNFACAKCFAKLSPEHRGPELPWRHSK